MIPRRATTLIVGLVLSAGVVFAQSVDVGNWPLQEERKRNYDALHYRIRLKLDVPGRAFEGKTTVTLTSHERQFDRCELDAESFTVSGVWNNWGRPLKFEQADGRLVVHFDKAYGHGATLSFTVAYAGRNPERGLRFYAKSEDNPMLAASDSWPHGVHHWFPCNDYPNDKVTNEVIVTINEPYKVASNGRLESVTRDAKKSYTWHWVQDQPHSTYLIVLAAAPYVVVRDAYRNIPVNYWVYPQHRDNARLVFGRTPKVLSYFERIYGYAYPWDKYDQIVVPFGGGAESTTATVMGHRIMYDPRGEQDFSSMSIVAHEIAHQWWGDLITLRSWAHAWMNEGFATYSEYLYCRHELGEDEAAVNLLKKKNDYLREAHTEYVRPIVYDRYRSPSDLFDNHSYRKGAAVLHMLRFHLSDEVFFRTLKRFLHEYAFQPVETQDFMNTVKAVSGRDMAWFFRQWVLQPGHPVFDIRCDWIAETSKVKLTVKQTQETSKGVAVFRCPVVIAMTSANGKTSEKVWIEHREQTFEFSSATRPLMVRFDEGNHLLKEWTFPKSRDELLYQLTHDDVIGRMWAAGELARYVTDQQVQAALENSARTDVFWAVRRSAIETLGKTQHSQNTATLRAASLDDNSAVRVAALRQLGKLKSGELVDFLKQRFDADDSYLAQAEALTSLGQCGSADVRPFLQTASTVPSPRHVIRSAARRALRSLP